MQSLGTALSAVDTFGPTARSVVLVEGPSDRAALLTLGERSGRDLAADGVEVVAMGGVTNVVHFLERLRPYDLRLAGLCDVAEERYVRLGLERSGIGRASTRAQRERLGFFACVDDMEDELIRAVGIPAVEQVLEHEGELASYRLFQRQPAQRDRTATAQLHRFLGTRSMRKIRYGRLLAEVVDLRAVPAPLAGVLAAV